MRPVLAVLACLLAADWHRTQARHATEPAAREANCLAVRVHHPDPRRLVRIIDCVTGDTTVERGRR